VETIKLTIKGTVPRKSNSREIVQRGKGGKPMLIKSKAARYYEKGFMLQVPFIKRAELGSKEHPLIVEADIYYPWKTRGDLSGEMILDSLTHAGVISDDRYVVKQVWRKRYDKKDPRAEITVMELDEWQWEREEEYS